MDLRERLESTAAGALRRRLEDVREDIRKQKDELERLTRRIEQTASESRSEADAAARAWSALSEEPRRREAREREQDAARRGRRSAKAEDGGASEVRERTATVLAPPGLLGLVIHDSADGPAVHALHPHSVLRGAVDAGDVVIEVDGAGARGWTAAELTRVMARTFDAPVRTFVFVKNPLREF